MIELEKNAYLGYTLCRMQECDFCLVKDFLDKQRNALDRIEFFYPYKDGELHAVLASGYFLGLFDGERLIATFAVDTDMEYAKTLANLINSFDGGSLQAAFESSGLMVDRNYRGRGIAKFMMSKIIEFARSRNFAICGVVHTQNVASMSTFFHFGFQLKAVWHMSEGYDFVYLLLQPNQENLKKVLQSIKNGVIMSNVKTADNADTDEHIRLLKDGYVGVECQENNILFLKKE